MKRIINLTLTCVVAFLTAFAFVACNNTSKLENAVKMANSECPIELGDYAEFTSIKYIDGKVQYILTVDDDLFDLRSIKENKQLAKKQIIMALSNPNSGSRELIEIIKEADADLVIVYKGSKSGKKVVLEITADELAQVNTDDYDAEENLQAQLELANAQCPITLDEGIVMDRVYVDGKHFVYHYMTDDDVIDIDILRSNITLAKKETIKELEGDMAVQTFTKTLGELNMDIRYIYESEQTGATAAFTIQLDELK